VESLLEKEIEEAPGGHEAEAGVEEAPGGHEARAGVEEAPGGHEAGAGVEEALGGHEAGAGVGEAPGGQEDGNSAEGAPVRKNRRENKLPCVITNCKTRFKSAVNATKQLKSIHGQKVSQEDYKDYVGRGVTLNVEKNTQSSDQCTHPGCGKSFNKDGNRKRHEQKVHNIQNK